MNQLDIPVSHLESSCAAFYELPQLTEWLLFGNNYEYRARLWFLTQDHIYNNIYENIYIYDLGLKYIYIYTISSYVANIK